MTDRREVGNLKENRSTRPMTVRSRLVTGFKHINAMILLRIVAERCIID